MENVKQYLLPILVIALSAISLTSSLPDWNYLSVIVSIVGLIGGYLHYKHQRTIDHWIELWLYAQIPDIYKTVFATAEKPEYEQAIYSVWQSQKYAFHLTLGWDDCTVYFGINVFPLFIIGLLMYLKISYTQTYE